LEAAPVRCCAGGSVAQLDAEKLVNKGQGGKAFGYLAVSTIVGLIAAWIGAALARMQA